MSLFTKVLRSENSTNFLFSEERQRPQILPKIVLRRKLPRVNDQRREYQLPLHEVHLNFKISFIRAFTKFQLQFLCANMNV